MITAIILALSTTLASPPVQEPAQQSSGDVANGTGQTASMDSDSIGSDAKSEALDRTHPDYVRCKRESVIGSRAKRKRTCMTNREWALVERRGNEASKTFAGDNFANGYN